MAKKDAQQVLVLARMVADFNMSVQVGSRTDCAGSRWSGPEFPQCFLICYGERQAGLVLSRSLKIAERLVAAGENDVEKIRNQVIIEIKAEKLAECEYVEVYEYPTLQDI